MAGVSFDAFYRGVRKGEVPKAVYLYGSEDVLKDEALAELLDQVLDPSVRDFNLDQTSAASLEPEQAETLCHTLPMMAERRVVIIRDVEAWNRRAKAKAVVLRYLERPAPETVLVLVQGAGDPDPDRELASRCTAVAAEPLPAERAQRWLLRHAGRLGVTLEESAAEHLVRATDGSLSLLRTELAKLSGLAGDEPITLDRVEALLGVRYGETQYDWRDLVLRGETARAIQVLPHVLAQSGVTGVSLVTMLGTSLIGIGLARAHYDRGVQGTALFQAVKGSLFRVRPPRMSYETTAKEWSDLAASWPAPQIEAALRAALAADDRLKSTVVSDERGILMDLVLGLGAGRRAAA